ncbi:MAG: hypothetical protein LBE83_06745 [Propionibacteriaceae bacterium]|jgi:drug/metabolite transporter (DMT)-like permease|nr:hypothetical protein [Propionibacteriaceae bacterium]
MTDPTPNPPTLAPTSRKNRVLLPGLAVIAGVGAIGVLLIAKALGLTMPAGGILLLIVLALVGSILGVGCLAMGAKRIGTSGFVLALIAVGVPIVAVIIAIAIYVGQRSSIYGM